MYLQETNSKEKRKIFEYSFADGLVSADSTEGKKIVAMQNIAPISYPSLSPRDPYFMWDIDTPISSIGILDDKVYYADENGGFYYDGAKKGTLTVGRKKFLNFNGEIIIFPDAKRYDPVSGTLSDLQKNDAVNITFINSSLGVNAIKSASSLLKLTDHFHAGQGVYMVGDASKDVIDGYHYIIGVDEEQGILYFNNYEFGSADIATCNCGIYNEVPKLSCACIVQNRVWGVLGNKVYASSVGDATSFCAFGGNDNDSFVCEYHDTEGFTACIEYGGYPVIFSNNKIYRVYGDNSNAYQLEKICNNGGILKRDIDSIAVIAGDVFYLSSGDIMRFSGNKSERIAKCPYKYLVRGYGMADKSIYYLACHDGDDNDRFLMYDVYNKAFYEQKPRMMNNMLKIGDMLYGLSPTTAYLMTTPESVPSGSEYEGFVESSFEISDTYDVSNVLYPARIYVRGYFGLGASLTFEISYDGDSTWQTVGTIKGEKYGIRSLSIYPRKCMLYRLRVKGKGYYCIKNMSCECILGK